MIDIHCHVLPDLDDGARTMHESMEMISLAIREGIQEMIVTPHYEAGMDETYREKYQDVFYRISQYIEEKNLPVKLYPGNEIFYSENVVSYLDEKTAFTMNETPYVLVEFPIQIGFQSLQRAVANLLYAGYWPILAHIERYEALKNIQNVMELVDMGAYMQVNASVVAGNRGWLLQRYCLKLMKKGLIHVVATDAHGSEHRVPRIKDAVRYMNKKLGKEYSTLVLEENPTKIIKGVRISG